MFINYVEGDATLPDLSDGLNYLIHVCNDRGAWRTFY